MNCENQEHATAIRNNIAMSIEAYEASPEVNQFSSKFDSFLAEEAELTEQEALGLVLFEGKGRCSGCHVSEGDRPLFTNFAFFNIGVPKNLKNPVYQGNSGFIDGGLGARLKDSGEMGKLKTPTLRNVDKRPGQGFVKAYMHNGVFKSLKEVVHFYNARDVDPAIAEPEVQENLVGFIGDLGLTDEEEDAIVAFLRTLSDQERVLPPQTSSNRSR
jgi:cytochrome c peroxidase